MPLLENIDFRDCSENNSVSTQAEALPEFDVRKEYYLVSNVSDDVRKKLDVLWEIHAVMERMSVNLKRVVQQQIDF